MESNETYSRHPGAFATATCMSLSLELVEIAYMVGIASSLRNKLIEINLSLSQFSRGSSRELCIIVCI